MYKKLAENAGAESNGLSPAHSLKPLPPAPQGSQTATNGFHRPSSITEVHGVQITSTLPLAPPKSPSSLPTPVKRQSDTPSPKPQTHSSRELSASPDLQDFVSIDGFQHDRLRMALFIMGCICSGGLLLIVCNWYSQLYTLLTKRRSSLDVATAVLVKGLDGGFQEVTVHKTTYSDPIKNMETSLTYIEYRTQRYLFRDGSFRLSEFDTRVKFGYIADVMRKGITTSEHDSRQQLYGLNQIVIPVEPLFKMLYDKVLHPFYLFQVFSCTVWYIIQYNAYATCILLLSALSIAWEIRVARKNAFDMRELATVHLDIKVYRDGQMAQVACGDLVPGDIVEVFESTPVVADMVLLSGECVVDESMLTGESTPLAKQPLPCLERPDAVYNPDHHKTYSLYCGSRVMQAKSAPGQPVLALVMRTGYYTSKGQLFRSILFPKPLKFKFQGDSYKFLAIMGVMSAVLLVVNMIMKLTKGAEAGEVILSSIDLVTIAVPPALPLVLTIGTGISVARLKTRKVFCIRPERINFAGRIDTMCFDKTGTLTHDSLDFSGVHEVDNGRFLPEVHDVSTSQKEIVQVMASCHALIRVGDHLVGHPVDVKMFESTHWKLSEPDRSKAEQAGALAFVTPNVPAAERTEILRRYEFDPRLQRSSVLARRGPQGSIVFSRVKGSPEAIRPLCRPETIPSDFDSVLREYTHRGLYVLACASKSVGPIDNATAVGFKREEAEADLSFLGFMMLQNTLKDESKMVIRQLADADIRSVIITGDNALTAVCVARDVGLIETGTPVYLVDMVAGDLRTVDVDRPEIIADLAALLAEGCQAKNDLAVTGAALAKLTTSDLFNDVIKRTRIFARVLPEQKVLVVETLILVHDKYVGMCGDGTNDCGALKAAHIGLSLSEAEASIVAPFTSQEKRVDDVLEVLREGRCALITSFVAFKYMALYPIIQLMMVLRLYAIDHTLADLQYLFDDLAMVLPLGALMCMTGPATTLVKQRPSSSLLNVPVLSSIIGQVIIQMLFLVGANEYLRHQPWFIPADLLSISGPIEQGQGTTSFENTVTWVFAHFQYFIVAVAFSTSKPFRKPLYTNVSYLLFLIGLFILTSYILLYPAQWLMNVFALMSLPANFKWGLFGLMLFNFVASYAYELVVIQVDKFLQQRADTKKKAEEAGSPLLPRGAVDSSGYGMGSTVPISVTTPSSMSTNGVKEYPMQPYSNGPADKKWEDLSI
mmetsp:Transcript_44124/g.71834  ORF Transcript_44124/g.71834 Transcript_44124/m.71834 type:complete len:1218 (+) Transcript_44124:80-3733(+)